MGVGQRGLDVVVALKRYGLLTIGDGLVSQIPALVLSTAAGVLVTRTASEEPGTTLGEELARQLFGIPKALGVAAAFVALLAVVPGLPAAPFLALAAGLAWAARARSRTLAREQAIVEAAPARAQAAEGHARRGPQFVPVVEPWGLEVAENLAPLLDDVRLVDGSVRAGLRTRSQALREALFDELGVPLPPARVRSTRRSPPVRRAIVLFEVPARLVTLTAPIARTTRDPDGAALIADAALELLRGRAADFLGLAETQQLLDELEQVAPAVVRNVVPKPVSLTTLSEVLRRLLEERVSIRDLRAILEALAPLGATEKDTLVLSEHVRAYLRRAITFHLTRGARQLGVTLLDPSIEDAIRHAVTRTASGAFLALPRQRRATSSRPSRALSSPRRPTTGRRGSSSRSRTSAGSSAS